MYAWASAPIGTTTRSNIDSFSAPMKRTSSDGEAHSARHLRPVEDKLLNFAFVWWGEGEAESRTCSFTLLVDYTTTDSHVKGFARA